MCIRDRSWRQPYLQWDGDRSSEAGTNPRNPSAACSGSVRRRPGFRSCWRCRAEPVSYTHLDVYKRQALRRTAGHGSARGHERPGQRHGPDPDGATTEHPYRLLIRVQIRAFGKVPFESYGGKPTSVPLLYTTLIISVSIRNRVLYRFIFYSELHREKGNGSRQCHSQGTELCTVAGHWQSQQSGNQGSHGRRIEEDAGL